ncbi:MAG: (d)CMP kinase [Planctomycetes bacterium]|nr:(d)CMP kinase [Planctomycetota bacterium]
MSKGGDAGGGSLLAGTLAAIAVDGPAGVGKSTVCRDAAAELGWKYIDSGAMYRSIALLVKEEGLPVEKWAEAVGRLAISFVPDGREQKVFLGKKDVTRLIRDREITDLVKNVADNAEVRTEARKLQKDLAGDGEVVMEGRDICTHVLPNARYKFYLDASEDARVGRRVEQLREMGMEQDAVQVRESMLKRDAQDRERSIAPLMRPPDAFYVDTTHMSRGEVVGFLVGVVRADRMGNV